MPQGKDAVINLFSPSPPPPGYFRSPTNLRAHTSHTPTSPIPLFTCVMPVRGIHVSIWAPCLVTQGRNGREREGGRGSDSNRSNNSNSGEVHTSGPSNVVALHFPTHPLHWWYGTMSQPHYHHHPRGCSRRWPTSGSNHRAHPTLTSSGIALTLMLLMCACGHPFPSPMNHPTLQREVMPTLRAGEG